MNGNDTTIEISNNNSTETNSNNLKKRIHITHTISSYWFRNIPKDTSFRTEPKDRCPSLLSEYIDTNICLTDAGFRGDYDEYAMFDNVVTQVKNYAIIYYPIIGIVSVASLILAYLFLKCFKRHQLEKKGYNDNQKILNDNEGFVEI